MPDLSNIPEEVLDQIRRDLADGDSVEEVAIRYDYDEDVIVVLAPKKRLNPKQEYSNDLEVVAAALQATQAQFNTDQSNTQRVYAITELLRSKRSVIDAIIAAEDPMDTFTEIDRVVLDPLIKGLIKALTQPLLDLRSSINRMIPETAQSYLRDSINQALRRQAEGIKDNYRGSRRNLAETLGIDPDETVGEDDEQTSTG